MGFFQTILNNVKKNNEEKIGSDEKNTSYDLVIALGVLMRIVADADQVLKDEEVENIKNALVTFCGIDEKSFSAIWTEIVNAEQERIDLHAFTYEINQHFAYVKRIEIIEILYRIACVDKDFDHQEGLMISQISRLLHLSHDDATQVKLRVKNEYGVSEL